QAHDRLGRRPCAADHLQPSLERLSLDARRRASGAPALGLERPCVGRSRRQRPRRRSGGARAHLPAVLVSRRLRHGARLGDRARARGSARWQHPARLAAGALISAGVGLPEPAPVFELPRRRSRLRAALVSLRPRQWTKNLLLFAGIIFAAKLGDLSRWGEAFAAFAAYCAASSASYLVNDVRDAPHDRLHPT